MFRLTEGRLELLIMSVYLVCVLDCVTHIHLQAYWTVSHTSTCITAGRFESQ